MEGFFVPMGRGTSISLNMGRTFLGKRKVTWTLYPATYEKVKALAKSQGRTASELVEEVLLKVVAQKDTLVTWDGFLGEKSRSFTQVEKKLFQVVYEAFLKNDIVSLRAFESFRDWRMMIGSELKKHGFDPFTVADPFTLCWCGFLSNSPEVARVWAYTIACLYAKLGKVVTFKEWTDAFSSGVPAKEEFNQTELTFIDSNANWPMPGGSN